MASKVTDGGPKKNEGNKIKTAKKAREMQVTSAAARKMRCVTRAKMLKAGKDRIYELYDQALATADLELLEFVCKACKLVGLEFNQSPEYVQKTEVVEDIKAKVDNKIEFVISKPEPKES